MATSGVVDHSALKVNQTGIVTTVLVAFIGSAFFRPLLLLIPLLASCCCWARLPRSSRSSSSSISKF